MTDKPVIVAKIGAPHGVHGDLKLYSFTEDPETLLSFNSLLIETKRTQFEPLSGAQLKRKGGGFCIQFDGFHDRDKAKCFVNKHLAVMRDQLDAPAEDEFYWSDLEGLTVINQDNVTLGKVDHLFDTGSNDVIFVKGEKVHLIPYIDPFLQSVDLKEGVIRVKWDEDF